MRAHLLPSSQRASLRPRKAARNRLGESPATGCIVASSRENEIGRNPGKKGPRPGRSGALWQPVLRPYCAARVVPVKVFGRLHDDLIHARLRQAYEKRQGTKSRLVGRRRRRGLYPGLIGVPALMLVDGTSPGSTGPSTSDALAGLEPAGSARNPGVLAQSLSR